MYVLFFLKLLFFYLIGKVLSSLLCRHTGNHHIICLRKHSVVYVIWAAIMFFIIRQWYSFSNWNFSTELKNQKALSKSPQFSWNMSTHPTHFPLLSKHRTGVHRMSAGVISCGLILFRNLLLLFKVLCYKFVGLSLCLVLPVVPYMLLISLLLCKYMLFL